MNNSCRINLLQISTVNIVLPRKYESFLEGPIQNFLFASTESLKGIISRLQGMLPYLRDSENTSKQEEETVAILN